MAKNSGSTRSINSSNASASRTYAQANSEASITASALPNNASTTSFTQDENYVENKMKEIKAFKLPKAGEQVHISINNVEYRITHEEANGGRHIIDVRRTSDNYSLGHAVYTTGGSSGMASTLTKGQVTTSLKTEFKNLLKHPI